jgi:hypothetical protein
MASANNLQTWLDEAGRRYDQRERSPKAHLKFLVVGH